MANARDGRVRDGTNGKIHPSRIRLLSEISTNGRVGPAFVRSSHSLSSKLAKQLRALAYRVRASESAVIECALWSFFDKGLDADILRLMGQANIKPRRRRV